MSLRTLIIDDEPLAREGLRMLLAEDPEIITISEARNGREGLEKIQQDKPDLIFLDMQMPEMGGLELVRSIGASQMPLTVFVTAYDRYAIDAFDANAIDYLLKPVTAQRFYLALTRAKQRLKATHPGGASDEIRSLLEALSPATRYIDRIAVKGRSKTTFVEVRSIDWVEASENYVQIHVADKAHLVAGTISALEKALDPALFVRVHRSAIVNRTQIREVEPGVHGEYQLTLHCGQILHSGRQYRENLKHLLSNPF
jgi:two-component system, LytTR family, response regulator